MQLLMRALHLNYGFDCQVLALRRVSIHPQYDLVFRSQIRLMIVFEVILTESKRFAWIINYNREVFANDCAYLSRQTQLYSIECSLRIRCLQLFSHQTNAFAFCVMTCVCICLIPINGNEVGNRWAFHFSPSKRSHNFSLPKNYNKVHGDYSHSSSIFYLLLCKHLSNETEFISPFDSMNRA